MKACSVCRIEKPREAFSAHSIAKDGLQGHCKSCAAAIYQANREHPGTPVAPDFDAALDCLPTFREVCKAVNETPVLMSMLYDLNLLPEQTMCDAQNWDRTWRVVNVVMNHLAALSAAPQSLNVAAQEASTWVPASQMGPSAAATPPQEPALSLPTARELREHLEAIIDVFEDGRLHPPGEGCYAPGALREVVEAAQAALKASPQPPHAEPVALHPATLDLVKRFTAALTNKLAAAEKKYGYSFGWRFDDWQIECRAKLMDHIEKGDPRDVAAYCAFMWHHGWSTHGPTRHRTAADDEADRIDQLRRDNP